MANTYVVLPSGELQIRNVSPEDGLIQNLQMSELFFLFSYTLNQNLTVFFSIILDGKYVVLPSGELQIRNVSPEDGFKTYKCRTKHRLTGETKLSATAGRLVITGKSA